MMSLQKQNFVPRKQRTAVFIELELGSLNGIQNFVLFILVDNPKITVSFTTKSNDENTHSKLS